MSETVLIDSEPLTVYQLGLVADEICENMRQYRPEFANLIHMQRMAGTRVAELFQPDRWQLVSNSVVQLQPQKGNSLRILNLSDLGDMSVARFELTLVDMRRLPKRQYQRAFSAVVQEFGLWRHYENGFMHPSSHLLRHVKIKELAQEGYSREYICTWIGERSVSTLDYYLNSEYFM